MNRRLHSIIQSSLLAQYILELDATANVDCVSDVAVVEKLRMLREHDDCRRRLNFQPFETLGPVDSNDVIQSCVVGSYGLLVEVLASPSSGTAEIRVSYLPTLFDPLPPQSMISQVDFCPTDHTFCEAANLLVLLVRYNQ